MQTHLVSLRRALLDRGIPCTVVNITRHRRADADGVYYPKNTLQLLRLLRKLPSDVIHLQLGGNLSTRLLGLAWVCSLLPRRKTVLTFHSGGYPSSDEGRAASPRTLHGVVLRRLDHLIGVNAEIVAFFRRLGCAPERVSLILPHAVDLARRGTGSEQGPDVALPNDLRRFFDSHRPNILSVGGLEPEYDVSLQLSLLTELRRSHPSAGLIIIGPGSLEAKLREHIAAMPDAEHVRLCGDVPHADTLRAMASSDIVLRTTLYDGDSISVREALHLGVPVLATDNGMRPRGVRLFPVGDLHGLLRLVLHTLNEPAQPCAGHGGNDGRENIAAVLALYERLISGGFAGRRES